MLGPVCATFAFGIQVHLRGRCTNSRVYQLMIPSWQRETTDIVREKIILVEEVIKKKKKVQLATALRGSKDVYIWWEYHLCVRKKNISVAKVMLERIEQEIAVEIFMMEVSLEEKVKARNHQEIIVGVPLQLRRVVRQRKWYDFSENWKGLAAASCKCRCLQWIQRLAANIFQSPWSKKPNNFAGRNFVVVLAGPTWRLGEWHAWFPRELSTLWRNLSKKKVGEKLSCPLSSSSSWSPLVTSGCNIFCSCGAIGSRLNFLL